jgi:hypothetical protein
MNILYIYVDISKTEASVSYLISVFLYEVLAFCYILCQYMTMYLMKS